MALRAVVVVMVLIFAIVLAQSTIAGPMLDLSTAFDDSGDYSNAEWDGNQIISDLPGYWFIMGLVGIFGLIAYGSAVILRRELTQGGL